MKIDKYELTKQRKTEIIEKGNFARLEIIIPRVTTLDKVIDPIVEFEVKNTNTATMVCLINILDALKESIYKQFPDTKEAMELIGTRIVNLGTIQKGDIAEVED